MIKLAKYIPLKEIKIVPNLGKPKIGDIFIYPDQEDMADENGIPHKYIITKIEGEHISLQYYPYNPNDYVFGDNIKEFMSDLQKGVIKIIKKSNLSEIKILPNQKLPKLDDIWSYDNPNVKYLDNKYSVQDIDNDEYYFIKIGSKGISFWMNKEQVIQNIKNKTLQFISSRVDEIKIIPNDGKPRNNEELEKFIVKNLPEFIQKINKSLYYQKYYNAGKVPNNMSADDIGMSTHYRDEGNDNIVETVLVWITNENSQYGNLYLSLNKEDIDYINSIIVKDIIIYYDITQY